VWARRLMDRLKREGGRLVDRFTVTKNKDVVPPQDK
jgi:hypothetical protein